MNLPGIEHDAPRSVRASRLLRVFNLSIAVLLIALLGAAYWYEDWRVQDFALDPGVIDSLIVRNPTNNALTGFYTGYANEPYTAHTFFARMRYLW